ncbi:hypothetical protein BCIN_12g03470 [Botrytis cinerea B05.10]|uniref:J domain-containing protein n=1 Tax=Botryotinia fuckeliana (strain B05.10) TaxID=332648 RepID=A0A384JYV4_BOTFB|nr:hypothetical protein BCIN_12g03470 [Botrytis cinerea B05.10]ATZ55786.1 hypothetical protein BCIN_12g03470 [Botrytis cinerea B05.10]
MAVPRGQRSYLPSPPASPSEQKPRPLPLPTEMTRYKTWQIARSSSMNVKSVPVPPLGRRSATAPVIGTTSNQFKHYDRSSSTEPETVPESVVQPEVPSRYTTSYYHILGLPESPDITTKEIEEAYQNLVSNPSSHPSHGYENLEQIRKTLTSSVRRRTYDRGRRAHSLQESQLNNRERFEKLNNDFDKISKAHKTITQDVKAFTENAEMKRLESELRMAKKEVAATIKREVKVMGLSMSLDGLDEEEGVPWEEMDFGTKSSQIVGERLGLEFEFNGSGSEDDSGDENGSTGTFSDREEERRHPRMSEESEQIKRLEEFEELPVSAITGLFPMLSSSELEKARITPEMISNNDQEGLDDKDERLPASEEAAPNLLEIMSKNVRKISEAKEADEKILNIPETTAEIMPKSNSNKEPIRTEEDTQEITKPPKIATNTSPPTSPPPIQTDLPDILSIVELLYPTPPPTPKANPKKKNISRKEIWEFDYNSDSDSECECDSDPDTEHSPEEPKILPSYARPISLPTAQLETPELHELPGSEIWELDYPNTNPSSSSPNTQDEEDEEERHETIILSLQFLIVFSLATAAWGWFGGGWVLNLFLNSG